MSRDPGSEFLNYPRCCFFPPTDLLLASHAAIRLDRRFTPRLKQNCAVMETPRIRALRQRDIEKSLWSLANHHGHAQRWE